MTEVGSDDLPTIVYVDENDDALEDFYLDAKKSKLFAQIILLKPQPHLETMLETLQGLKFEALVSDFRLADAAPVDYDGAQLVDHFGAIRIGFPCFIRTSYEQEALHAADDVNTIYSKEDGSAQEIRPLLDRVRLQVVRHRRLIESWNEELEALLSLDRATLSADMVDRILDLDTKLETSLGTNAALSKTSKRAVLEKSIFEGRRALIEETERLVADIRKALND